MHLLGIFRIKFALSQHSKTHLNVEASEIGRLTLLKSISRQVHRASFLEESSLLQVLAKGHLYRIKSLVLVDVAIECILIEALLFDKLESLFEVTFFRALRKFFQCFVKVFQVEVYLEFHIVLRRA